MITLTWIDEDGNDEEEDFPHKNVICGSCDGEGKIWIGCSELDEPFYHTCETCKGVRVLQVVDESKFDEYEKEEYASYLKAKKEEDRSDREWRGEIAHGALQWGRGYLVSPHSSFAIVPWHSRCNKQTLYQNIISTYPFHPSFFCFGLKIWNAG